MPGLLAKDQVGVREDLSDLIAVADVKATPFSSMVPKSSELTNHIYDWQMDGYEDPNTDGVVDGLDVSDYSNAARKRKRQKSYIQIKRRTAKVSRVAESVDKVAGLKSEISKAASKKLIEMKRDIEATLLSSNEHQDDDGSVPWKIRGLGAWIDSSAQSGDFAVDSEFRPAAAQIDTTATASLDEDDNIQAMLQAIFDATGMGEGSEYVLIAGSVLRRKMTDMTRTDDSGGSNTFKAVRHFSGPIDGTKIVSTTSVFQGDFGLLDIIPSSFIGWSGGAPDTDRGYVVPISKVHLRYNTRPGVENFEDQGGGPRIMVEGRIGFQVDNPKCFGKFLPS
jgi:hypothetical protein